MPGGGVEAGETLAAALTRELREEGNIELIDQPRLFGVYFNRRVSRRDHVALYVVRSFRQDAPPQPNYEIVAHGFFAPDALPEGTRRARRVSVSPKFSRGRAAPNFGRRVTFGRVILSARWAATILRRKR